MTARRFLLVLCLLAAPGMQRCRGFDLTELNRLHKAEAAYKESLTHEPNNALAMRELVYIAGLQAGSNKARAGQVTIRPPGAPPPQAPPPPRPPI